MRRLASLAAMAAIVAFGSSSSVLAATPASASYQSTADANDHEQLPIEGVVTNPDWLQLPSGEDMSRFYPPLANTMNINGLAFIRCKVTALGMLDACAVEREAPLGLGFAQAALSMAPLFRMKPMSVDGVPVAGALVTIPIKFATANQRPPADEETSAAPPPAPRALALSRRLVAALGTANRATLALQRYMEQMHKAYDGGADLDELSQTARKEALEAFSEAYEAGIASYLEQTALTYARTYSEKELTDTLAFMESPSGKVWVLHQPEIEEAGRKENMAIGRLEQADARRRFCLKVSCPPGQPVASSSATAAAAR